MKLKTCSMAILLSILPISAIHASALDRSGQSISAFLQSGHYTEAGISILDPRVSGHDITGHAVSDMAGDYYFPNAAVKVQATDQISFGLLYDQPFGADAMYPTSPSIFTHGVEGTSVEVKTQNLTGLMGYQPTENWNIYAGVAYQTVQADIALRGAAYNNTGYKIDLEQEDAFGWVAGIAYQIPEIALKAALTYRSEIEHNATSIETTDLAKLATTLPDQDPRKALFSQLGHVESTTKAVTPQSVNLDFQTGVASNTIAFANLRWVHWSQFAVRPSVLGALGQNLIDYSDDQWSANVGVGHKFNRKWAGNASMGWDSGAGNPVTTLGPTEGYWSIGLGGQYSPTEHYFLQAGVKYFWLGDAKAQTAGRIVGEFEDNHAIGYVMKMGYKF